MVLTLAKIYLGIESIKRCPGLAMQGGESLQVFWEMPSPGRLFFPGSQSFMFQDYHQDEIARRCQPHEWQGKPQEDQDEPRQPPPFPGERVQCPGGTVSRLVNGPPQFGWFPVPARWGQGLILEPGVGPFLEDSHQTSG
jgi:hypothetical protein